MILQHLPIRSAAGDIIAGTTHPVAELSLLPLFSGLPPEDLSWLLQAAWVQHYSDGHDLFLSRQPAQHLYVVLDGHVELYSPGSPGRNVLEIAQCPTVLGESALSPDGLYSESARIVGHSRLLVIPATAFLTALQGRFDLALRLLSSMSVRLHGLVTQISSLKLKSTAQRLAGFLLGIADTHQNVTRAHFPYDKRLVAQYLGMTAESLSRALARLAPLGVTSNNDNTVTMDDLAALRAFCGEDSTP